MIPTELANPAPKVLNVELIVVLSIHNII